VENSIFEFEKKFSVDVNTETVDSTIALYNLRKISSVQQAAVPNSIKSFRSPLLARIPRPQSQTSKKQRHTNALGPIKNTQPRPHSADVELFLFREEGQLPNKLDGQCFDNVKHSIFSRKNKPNLPLEVSEQQPMHLASTSKSTSSPFGKSAVRQNSRGQHNARCTIPQLQTTESAASMITNDALGQQEVNKDIGCRVSMDVPTLLRTPLSKLLADGVISGHPKSSSNRPTSKDFPKWCRVPAWWKKPAVRKTW
jgi:hypothetical protein